MPLRTRWWTFWLRFNLRAAYSAERGAALAYAGHAASASTPGRRREIEEILRDELRHRERVGRMLAALGARPWRWLDLILAGVGSCVAFGCRFWGDWASAVGASGFEVNGAAEYRRAAHFAQLLGHGALAAGIREMQEQEEAHVIVLRRQAAEVLAGLRRAAR